MAIPVSYSATPQVLDAVGAVKVTEYYGNSKLDNVYTYLRTYVENGSLVFSITSFEKAPTPESRTAAAFSFGSLERSIFISCNAQGKLTASLFSRQSEKDLALGPVSIPAALVTFSVDEKGEGWSFTTRLPAENIWLWFAAKLVPGSVFAGNVYKYCEGEDAFGAAFPCKPGVWPPAQENFGEFVVVPY